MKNTNTTIATVNTTNTTIATVNNAKKSNVDILSLVDTTTMIQKMLVGTKCKTFTDSTYYVGFGTKSNGFSVNTKKTKYNVYCNDTNFELLSTLKLDGVTFTKNGNTTDKTRPNYIECKNTKSLITMINAIVNNVYKVATDNN